MPSAYRSSPSVEKTGSRCWSTRGRSAAVHNSLSRPASSAILPQRSAVEVCNGLDRTVDLLVAVCDRHEHALELARRDVHALPKQVTEERAVAVGVALLRVVEIAHRLFAHEQRRHWADALEAAMPRETRLEPRRLALERAIDALVPQAPQHRQTGCGRERIARQRPCLVDVAARREPVHDVGATAERGERQAAADDLSED